MGLLDRLLRLAGPTRGIPMASDPTDAPIPNEPLRPLARDERVYRVKRGDTPQSIARDVYGDPTAWSRIQEANRTKLGDPPLLYPGLELSLP